MRPCCAGAFRELYDRWAQRLLGFFYRRVLDAEVAADLLADQARPDIWQDPEAAR